MFRPWPAPAGGKTGTADKYMPKISDNIKHLLRQIDGIAENYDRAPGSVRLLAVSKTRTPGEIRQAVEAGQRAFGENYLQEGLEKIESLRDLDLEWHFIGPIQANKTRAIAGNFHWVHSVDRLKIATRLNDQRPANLPPLNICIQVNIDDETSKAGVPPEDAAELALAVADLPRLRLRGLMAIPAPAEGINRQREPFFRLRQLLGNLRGLSAGLSTMDTLSMGMSDDMEAAIAEGTTIVRVGTAIFGERPARQRQPAGH